MEKFNRENKIFKISKTNLETIINESESLTEVLLKLGYTPNGNQLKNLKQRCLEEKINLSNVSKRKARISQPVQFYLKENFYVSSNFLKNKLLKSGLLTPKCSRQGCSVSNEWIGTPISLHLDHINGIHTDNRIENLRLLCPNCHSQTNTYSGRNRSKSKDNSNLFNFKN